MDKQAARDTKIESMITLPKSIGQDILHYIEYLEDEGPSYAGWQSQRLMNCIGVLQDALEHARTQQPIRSHTKD